MVGECVVGGMHGRDVSGWGDVRSGTCMVGGSAWWGHACRRDGH